MLYKNKNIIAKLKNQNGGLLCEKRKMIWMVAEAL
jgi:hypothetical protein